MFIAVATCALVEPLDYAMVLLASPNTVVKSDSGKVTAQTSQDVTVLSPVIPASSSISTSSNSSRHLDLPDTADRYHSNELLDAYDEASSYASEINATAQPLLQKRESRRLQLKQQLSIRSQGLQQQSKQEGVSLVINSGAPPHAAPRTFRLLKQELLVQRSLLPEDDLDEFDEAWGIDKSTNDFIDLSRSKLASLKKRSVDDDGSDDEPLRLNNAKDSLDVESLVKHEVALVDKIAEH
eukprot:gene49033-60023_t